MLNFYNHTRHNTTRISAQISAHFVINYHSHQSLQLASRDTIDIHFILMQIYASCSRRLQSVSLSNPFLSQKSPIYTTKSVQVPGIKMVTARTTNLIKLTEPRIFLSRITKDIYELPTKKLAQTRITINPLNLAIFS